MTVVIPHVVVVIAKVAAAVIVFGLAAIGCVFIYAMKDFRIRW